VGDPLELLAALAGIAGEEARADWVEDQLSSLGLSPKRDDEGNVWAGSGELLLVAHLDTVLPPQGYRVDGGRWYGPGLGDNSAGVAVLLSEALALSAKGVTLAFSVGEEGLGNLRGARALVRQLGPRRLLAVDGYVPTLVAQAVGSVRLRAIFQGPGGHAWGDRQRPSPVPALGEALVGLYRLDRSAETSLNVGRVWGGEAINAIPQAVGLELDLRARDPEELKILEQGARAILMEAARAHGVELSLKVLGERPAGSTVTPDLLAACVEALRQEGVEPRLTCGSTDAAAGVELGIPALALGVYRGGGAHTPEEWVEPESLWLGKRLLRRVVEVLCASVC